MSWERQKSTISAKPEEPSFTLWIMAGILGDAANLLI